MIETWADIEERTVVPGMHGRFVHSEHMTFALWRIDAGAVIPPHSHPHEQVVNVHSGELELVVSGETHRLTAGTVFVIPGNAPHTGRALSEVSVLDVFSPVREDYRSGGPAVLAAAREG